MPDFVIFVFNIIAKTLTRYYQKLFFLKYFLYNFKEGDYNLS